MRVACFDCFAGVSGDMIIGAQLDLGIDRRALIEQLSLLDLSGYEIKINRVKRAGIAATKFDVEVEESEQPERRLEDIRAIIHRSNLSDSVKARSMQVFERLAEAEARVHGTTFDQVHFHEVGAVDSIVDIVGAMIGFELLGVEGFFCSPLRLGFGSVKAQHGTMPIPAPATAELLQGAPVYAGDIEGEFVTPTGAAIVTTLCEQFTSIPRLHITRIGYGAGSRNPAGFPNALRLVLGEVGNQARGTVDASETVFVVETNIDDMNPQAYGFVMERAFALGALDAFLLPAQMKKDRPGTLITVLCKAETLESMIDMLIAETTTLGVRYYEASRQVLERAMETVETEYGSVRIKVARRGDRTLNFQPEYDDCARLAKEMNVPLLEVQAAASAAYRRRFSKPANNE